jgi:ribulose-bisphosphate carboxylase large chain
MNAAAGENGSGSAPDRLTASYLVETPLAVADAAAVMAGEQSSGTFIDVPGETEALKERFAARVEKISEISVVPTPALPGAQRASGYRRAIVEISWPIENFGHNLPALVSTVQGNLYELSQFSGIRLLDIGFPRSFLRPFRGPCFGVPGTRRLAGVEKGPLIGTIVKPSIGLTPAQTAELVATVARAGIDFIKDDELMADPPHSPFATRLEAVMGVVREHAQRTGKKVMYAFNISGEMDDMLRNYDRVAAAGGTCVMVSLNSVGLAATRRICGIGRLAVHGHRNGWGMLNRYPFLGMDFAAYAKIWRLAGVDHLHVNGLSNKFWEPDDSVVHSIESCRAPLGGIPPIVPVVSSGQWGGQAPATYRQTGTADLLYLAGGGILAHPDGPVEGVRALRLWWDAALAGLTFDQAMERHPELARPAALFGRIRPIS